MTSSGSDTPLESYLFQSPLSGHVPPSGGYGLSSLPVNLLHKLSIKINNVAVSQTVCFKLTWLIFPEVSEGAIK